MIVLHENIWGHKNRIKWFCKFINKKDKGLEFGCGTGVSITSQLLQEGYDVIGLDPDAASIEIGRSIFEKNDLDRERLTAMGLDQGSRDPYDYIIASEVFEHIPKDQLSTVLCSINDHLKEGGLLLVTVPNGYGSHEIESFFWKTLGLKFLFKGLLIEQGLNFIRKKIGVYFSMYPSTMSTSPHVRRFLWNSIPSVLSDMEFDLLERRGSALIAGPFSDMLFSGIGPLMKLNIWLGKHLGLVSSGFYYVFRKKTSKL